MGPDRSQGEGLFDFVCNFVARIKKLKLKPKLGFAIFFAFWSKSPFLVKIMILMQNTKISKIAQDPIFEV